MTFTLLTNFACMILCCAVLVQSMRLMRSLRAVKDGSLGQTVKSLDNATILARSVLTDMKVTLARDVAANAQTLDEAKAIRDELNMMIGIGDAIAERISNASSAANAIVNAAPAKSKKTRARKNVAEQVEEAEPVAQVEPIKQIETADKADFTAIAERILGEALAA